MAHRSARFAVAQSHSKRPCFSFVSLPAARLGLVVSTPGGVGRAVRCFCFCPWFGFLCLVLSSGAGLRSRGAGRSRGRLFSCFFLLFFTLLFSRFFRLYRCFWACFSVVYLVLFTYGFLLCYFRFRLPVWLFRCSRRGLPWCFLGFSSLGWPVVRSLARARSAGALRRSRGCLRGRLLAAFSGCVGLSACRRRSRVPAGARLPVGASLCRAVVGVVLVAAPAFSLVGPVAVAGSRHGSPWSGAVVRAVAASGCAVRTGCARGVDQCARSVVPASRLVVVSASAPAFAGLPPARALAARTRSVVSGAACLVACPGSSGALGRGTGLAVSTAVGLGLPVFVAGPVRPTGSGWSAASLGGVSGWAFFSNQLSLF